MGDSHLRSVFSHPKNVQSRKREDGLEEFRMKMPVCGALSIFYGTRAGILSLQGCAS